MSPTEFSAEAEQSFPSTLSGPELRQLIDQPATCLFELVMHGIHADEGSIWLADARRESLVMAFNSGSYRAELEDNIVQPLSEGIVSKAYVSGEPVADTGAFHLGNRSIRVDGQLRQYTVNELAVPFFMFGQKIGCVTAVQLMRSRLDGLGFHKTAFEDLRNAVEAFARLLEYSWLRLR